LSIGEPCRAVILVSGPRGKEDGVAAAIRAPLVRTP
jgi:hypothetical protein